MHADLQVEVLVEDVHPAITGDFPFLQYRREAVQIRHVLVQPRLGFQVENLGVLGQGAGQFAGFLAGNQGGGQALELAEHVIHAANQGAVQIQAAHGGVGQGQIDGAFGGVHQCFFAVAAGAIAAVHVEHPFGQIILQCHLYQRLNLNAGDGVAGGDFRGAAGGIQFGFGAEAAAQGAAAGAGQLQDTVLGADGKFHVAGGNAVVFYGANGQFAVHQQWPQGVHRDQLVTGQAGGAAGFAAASCGGFGIATGRRHVAVQGDLVEHQVKDDLAAFQAGQAGAAAEGAVIQGQGQRAGHDAAGLAAQGGVQGNLAQCLAVGGFDGRFANRFEHLVGIEGCGGQLAAELHVAGEGANVHVAFGLGAGGLQQQVLDGDGVLVQVYIQILFQMHIHRHGGGAGDIGIQCHRVEDEMVIVDIGGQYRVQIHVHAHVALVLIAQGHLQREGFIQVHVLGIQVKVLDDDVGAIGGAAVANLAVADHDFGNGQRNVQAAAALVFGRRFFFSGGVFCRRLRADLLPVGAVRAVHQVYIQAGQGDAVHFDLAVQQR